MTVSAIARLGCKAVPTVSAKVMFHGATETEQEFSKVKEWIKAEHPGDVSPIVFAIFLSANGEPEGHFSRSLC